MNMLTPLIERALDGQQVRITMPAPDNQLYTQLVVIHYLKDGSIEYITPIYNADGTLSFVTTSFSPYDVAGLKLAGSQSLVGNTDKAYGNKNTTSSSAPNTAPPPESSNFPLSDTHTARKPLPPHRSAALQMHGFSLFLQCLSS